jgi:hypothetical protein
MTSELYASLLRGAGRQKLQVRTEQGTWLPQLVDSMPLPLPKTLLSNVFRVQLLLQSSCLQRVSLLNQFKQVLLHDDAAMLQCCTLPKIILLIIARSLCSLHR